MKCLTTCLVLLETINGRHPYTELNKPTCLKIIIILMTKPCGLLITSAKEVMFSPAFVCGFVSLFVNKITQKLMDGF